MFELTNEQRKCFALPPVLEAWERIEVKKGPYDTCNTYAYIDGQRQEYHLCVKIIEDNLSS